MVAATLMTTDSHAGAGHGAEASYVNTSRGRTVACSPLLAYNTCHYHKRIFQTGDRDSIKQGQCSKLIKNNNSETI